MPKLNDRDELGLLLVPTAKYHTSKGADRYEQVMIVQDNPNNNQRFILGVTHVDAFHVPQTQSTKLHNLYIRLWKGEEVKIAIRPLDIDEEVEMW